MKKYIFTYCTINTVNNKYYVGYHSTNNLNDGYIGCGVRSQSYAESAQRSGLKSAFIDAVCKYGYNKFDTVVLEFHSTIEDARKAEAFIVDEMFVKDPQTYNIAIGGNGGNPFPKDVYKSINHEIVSILHNSDIPLNEGANMLGISYSCLRKRSLKYTPGRKTTPIYVRKYSHLFDEIQAAYLKGSSIESLRVKYGCDFKTVKKILGTIKRKEKYLTISPTGEKIYFTNPSILSRNQGQKFFLAGITDCIRRGVHKYKGWYFYKNDDE